MNSYRNNQKRTSSGVLLVATLVIVAVLFGADYLSRGTLRSYTRMAGALIWTTASTAGSAFDVRLIFSSKQLLIDENKALTEHLFALEEQSYRFESLEEENAMLRDMVRMADSEDGVTATVLSTFRSSPYGTFVIGAGADDGVTLDATVLTPGGFVLGNVTSVGSRSARVQSLFAPGRTTDFLIGDLAFAAEGRGGGNTRTQVARDAQVSVGDVVTVPAFGGRSAGIVGSIESASSSATKTLYIRIPVNLNSLSFVYVIPH